MLKSLARPVEYVMAEVGRDNAWRGGGPSDWTELSPHTDVWDSCASAVVHCARSATPHAANDDLFEVRRVAVGL